MERLTEGGKARRILLDPEAFIKDNFAILSIKDLADYLDVSEEEVKQYQQEADQLSSELTKKLAKLFDDLGSNGYAAADDDRNSEADIKEKAMSILNNPKQFWDDETNKPLTIKGLAKHLGHLFISIKRIMLVFLVS